MDSVLSNGQNDQSTQYNGKKAPEYVVADKDDELDDTHHRLLFGGNTTQPTETSIESTITATIKTGGSVQRARDTSPELNLVNIVALSTPATTRSDVRPNAPASSYESNPLPTQAKLGVAGTVGLQSQYSDNITPPGRRSAASDKVSMQLANDSTPAPLLVSVRMSDLDPVTKHQMAIAGTNDLFERLRQPVQPGTKDDTTMSVKTGGTSRRAPAPIDSYIASPSQLPAIGANGSYRPAADRVDPAAVAPVRGSTDNRTSGIITGATGVLPDAIGTIYSATVKPKTAGEMLGALDNMPLPKPSRSLGDGIVSNLNSGMQNVSDIVNTALPAIRRSGAADHAIIQPLPLDPATSIGHPPQPAADPVRSLRQVESNP